MEKNVKETYSRTLHLLNGVAISQQKGQFGGRKWTLGGLLITTGRMEPSLGMYVVCLRPSDLNVCTLWTRRCTQRTSPFEMAMRHVSNLERVCVCALCRVVVQSSDGAHVPLVADSRWRRASRVPSAGEILSRQRARLRARDGRRPPRAYQGKL